MEEKTYRQRYHLMPEKGWMNDPNGLIFYKGKYHFFYQHYPYAPVWGSMHWGHAVSDDMIHWEYLPIALTPDKAYEDHPNGGCFSGSAIEHEGKLFVMYTGSIKINDVDRQVQCIAWSEDGIHFEKYQGNPVIEPPQGVTNGAFRDPKVWRHENTFYMVCGASINNCGQVLLYKSKDLFQWEYVSSLVNNQGELGFMFECPDFFKLDDKYVLVISPMGMKGHKCLYLVGDFDYETELFDYCVMDEIDWGLHFYAPASFEAPDGRRIMVA